MTLIACPIFISAAGEVSSALERAAGAARAGARLIEWRIDALAEEPDAGRAIMRLVRESPAPCIVTCRTESEGGLYSGDDQMRISLLEAIGTADHPPRYFDLELASYERSANLQQKIKLVIDHPDQARNVETSLILSAHDFEMRPADLLQRIERMSTDPACAIIKVAWTARSLRDNLDAFDLLTERNPDHIFVAGDLSDPHGTHRMCYHAIKLALERYREQTGDGQRPLVWLYRGAWQEWEIDVADVFLPLSKADLTTKIEAIFKHESQKDRALFPGAYDDREFWQRARDRNCDTAEALDALGLPEFYAAEAYVTVKDMA